MVSIIVEIKGEDKYQQTSSSLTSLGIIRCYSYYIICVTFFAERQKSSLVIFPGNTHQKCTAKFCIGSWGEIANNRWIGQIDEFRVTKGIARYTPDGASQSGIVPDN